MSSSLKSTYKAPLDPLPAPWTQHKAPSGHTYYYNSETKQSTYTRPGISQPPVAQPSLQTLPEPIRYVPGAASFLPAQNSERFTPSDRPPRPRQPQDRPKSKLDIPDHSPWILVKTRLGRRFVHNPDTNESFWKVPDHLSKAVIDLDIAAAKKRAGLDQPEETKSKAQEPIKADVEDETLVEEEDEIVREFNVDQQDSPSESDGYEEVEVTDNEDDGEEREDEENPAKRQRTDQALPAEMGEEDMAYQLEQMGQAYDLDPGEYGDQGFEEEWEEGAQGLELTNEEAELSFQGLLDDYKINPYSTWDAVIAEGAIVEDNRYTLLPTMKARKGVFAEWSAQRIQSLRQQKEKQTKQNPRIPYLAFLEKHANSKLFWPEFKRKYKREHELKHTTLSEKDREKLYREHITRTTKMSESAREKDLQTLLKSIPPSETWNQSTSLDDMLPSDLLTDIRFISIRGPSRDSIIQSHIASLPTPDQISVNGMTSEQRQSTKAQDKLKQAVQRREQEVQEAKRQQEREIRQGQRRLRDENLELEKAMKVDKRALGNALEAE